MSASPCKPNIAAQLLKILQTNGPTSIELLQRMTEPPAPKKYLRQSLARLRKKGLVASVVLNSTSTFYQLTQSKVAREEVAEKLNTTAVKAAQPLLRKQDWFHNQWCEYWASLIKRRFPTAEVVREHTIGGHEVAKRVLQLKQRDFELMPDFLLIFPKTIDSAATHIAFEIERTRKSDRRLMRKFKKYLNGTHIDGLIYICDSSRLSETLRLLYQTKLVAQAHRVKHYGDHFFLFSDSLGGGGPDLNGLLNAKGELVNFENWCRKLRSTKWTLRRDSEFTE